MWFFKNSGMCVTLDLLRCISESRPLAFSCFLLTHNSCILRVGHGSKSYNPDLNPQNPNPEPAGPRVDYGSRLAWAGRDPIAASCAGYYPKEFFIKKDYFCHMLHHVTCTLWQPAGFGSKKTSTRDPDPLNLTRKPAGLTRTRAPP